MRTRLRSNVTNFFDWIRNLFSGDDEEDEELFDMLFAPAEVDRGFDSEMLFAPEEMEHNLPDWLDERLEYDEGSGDEATRFAFAEDVESYVQGTPVQILRVYVDTEAQEFVVVRYGSD